MRVHLVVAAAAALVSGVVAQGCGSPARCSPASCATGCCDATGICQSGNSTTACGARGNTCQPCGLGLSCIGGTCMSLGTGAGTSGTGGGFSTGGGSAAGGSAGGDAGGSAAGGSAAGGSAAG
ncbi:MAG: hypothetical protein JNJ54_36265, partial [Myxococcaceae bacterium]|nr:hypothetical protein [Myxococcaceae bacterium]